MNIFYTNACPQQSAHNHCLVHTRKMIIEYAQMLSTAPHELDKQPPEGIYKATHKNHPSAVWVRQSVNHYNWLYQCFTQLCTNYGIVSGKQHKTDIKLSSILKTPPANISALPFVAPPQCMPEKYKHIDTIKAYKRYMVAKFQEWQTREKPIKVEFLFNPDWI